MDDNLECSLEIGRSTLWMKSYKSFILIFLLLTSNHFLQQFLLGIQFC